MDDTVYVYDPFVSEKDILSVVLWKDCPLLRFRYHVVPDGRPVSVKVT
jgi:hypothetical protein